MRHRLHIILALMSCCILCFTQSCSSDKKVHDPSGTDAKSNENSMPVNPNEAVVDIPNPPVVVPVAPGPATPIPLPPPPPPNLFGEGSQGALQPTRTGHKDEPFIPGPNGVCGNGVQEVLPNNRRCDFDLYGTTIDDLGRSNLVGFNLAAGGAGSIIGAIGPNLENVAAIDFAPDGTLYGVGERVSDSTNVFIAIDCQNGISTIIGPTGTGTITDIDFDSIGSLFALVQGSPQTMGLINPLTGQFVGLGSETFAVGEGLGSIPFPADMLYAAGNPYVSLVNKLTGIAAVGGPSLSFSAPAVNSPFLTGIDADYWTNTMYVAINNTTDNYLGILSVSSGIVSFLANVPPLAPEGLNGIASNRRYEECDPNASNPPLPAGTSCTLECRVIETDCFDGIDNNQNGLTDCADPACLNQTCNDGNGCTVDDVCTSIGVDGCVGTPVVCADLIGNECVNTTCNSISTAPGNDNFNCSETLNTDKSDFGSCTPRFNCDDDERNPDGTCPSESVRDHCIIGRCVQIPGREEDPDYPIFCEPAAKTAIPREEGGCVDDNTCTADGCHERSGRCEYDTMTGEICTDGNDCTTGDICVGVDNFRVECIGSPVAAATVCGTGNDCATGACNGDGVCVSSAVGSCEVGTDCPSGSCSDGACTCDDGNNCTTADACSGTSCAGTPLGSGTPCVDGCFTGATCNVDGSCITPVSPQIGTCPPATDDGVCIAAICTENGCEAERFFGPVACTVIVDSSICNGFTECDGGRGDPACIPVSPPVCTPIK